LLALNRLGCFKQDNASDEVVVSYVRFQDRR
jgi:hypothetical protein